MRRLLVLGVLTFGGCGGDNAAPCEMSADENVDHLASIYEDEAAWNEWAVELADNCPAKHTLVRERLLELGG
jgi:hypothetical protein